MKRFALPKFVMQRLLQPYWRMSRGLTLGVRGIVVDDTGRVLLVRHSYVNGAMFPGGGVEWTETLGLSLERELAEEVGIRVAGKPVLFGVYANSENFPGDHVAVFLVRDWTGSLNLSLEIADAAFYALDALPEDITEGTRRRIAEVFEDAEPEAVW